MQAHVFTTSKGLAGKSKDKTKYVCDRVIWSEWKPRAVELLGYVHCSVHILQH